MAETFKLWGPRNDSLVARGASSTSTLTTAPHR
eukprot:CAMPEP_0114278542 /NCGR_PEP_ID=MMETSP0059-20121206/1395_1 /TAXON_ID=36894 /ORGANISM="Pyramimonas parkeae, Strain CCMP726" /LENGTH=32 /DNA_ID= /DNA_START= /DNA_END= /DNA_ORIENTATION=